MPSSADGRGGPKGPKGRPQGDGRRDGRKGGQRGPRSDQNRDRRGDRRGGPRGGPKGGLSGPVHAPPGRAMALEALATCLDLGRDIQAALDQAISRREDADPRDAALATELSYGCLRRMGRTEFALSRFLDKPERLPDDVRRILTLAAHEILNLDRVPFHASVDWGVEAVKSRVEGLAGLANAVLRRVTNLGDEAEAPEFYAQGARSEAEAWTRQYACPRWIVDLWRKAYGPEDAERLLLAQIRQPHLGLCLDPATLHLDELARDLDAAPGRIDRQGLGWAFAPGERIEALDHAPPGSVHRQSFAARQALLALDPAAWPGPVWDACAGRGNKTRILRELGKTVYASDVHAGRIRALRREQPDVPAFLARADRPCPLKAAPGAILLDAPCSGLGTLARRPDIKHHRTRRDAEAMARTQARMLDAAWSSLAPGGRIAYLTCTLNPAENEDQVAAFLARTPGAEELTRFATPPASPLGEFFFASLIAKP